MRPGSKEVNVVERAAVPRRSWLARLYLWACERLYDELAWQYDLVSWLVSMGQWQRWQSAIWPELRGRDVLELGSGTGMMLTQAAARNLRITGVDRSPRMLAVAHSKLTRRGMDVPLLCGDGRALAVAAGAFDTIFATFPAGYILEPDTLAEIHRILRPGGRLVIVGLWVELHLGELEKLVPLFYGKPQLAALNAIRERVEASGFTMRWVNRRERWWSVGLLVADRE
jgi:ubiquinone/menaquinone biosynthesis C-methylase UbiE